MTASVAAPGDTNPSDATVWLLSIELLYTFAQSQLLLNLSLIVNVPFQLCTSNTVVLKIISVLISYIPFTKSFRSVFTTRIASVNRPPA